MKKMLEKTFEVPGSLKVEKIEEETGKIILYSKSRPQTGVECKFCGGEVRKYDYRTSDKRHTVVSGKTIWLRITRRRLQCKECKKEFVEPLEGISRSEFSDHFTQQVQEKARGQDYSTVRREMKISCSSVSKKVRELNVSRIHPPEKKG